MFQKNQASNKKSNFFPCEIPKHTFICKCDDLYNAPPLISPCRKHFADNHLTTVNLINMIDFIETFLTGFDSRNTDAISNALSRIRLRVKRAPLRPE